jgi:hypothetical protein
MVTFESHTLNVPGNSTVLENLENSILHELTRAMALPQTQNIKTLTRLIFGRAHEVFLNWCWEWIARSN